MEAWTVSFVERAIIHVDMDAFFASVEMLDVETIEVLRQAGGNVIGVASIGNRNPANPFDVPFRSLVKFDFPVHQPDDCPICRDGIPVEKPGSRTKA